MEEKKASNGMATAGFILALLTFFFGAIPVLGWILWILGLVFSIIGLSKASQLGGTGKGLAIAGLVISLIDLVMILFLATMILGLLGIAAGSGALSLL